MQDYKESFWESYDARMSPPKVPGTWIQVKINGVIKMPWPQMALISDICPGQFFYSDDDHASYLIFSGEGLPHELASIPKFVNNHPYFCDLMVEDKCVSAKKISHIPNNAQSLHQKMFLEGFLASGSPTILRVQQYIKNRYERLASLIPSAKENEINDIIVKLEQTACQLYKMRNTESDIDIITPINFISRVLLTKSDTNMSSLSAPLFEKHASCHHFLLTKKINSLRSPTLLDAAKAFRKFLKTHQQLDTVITKNSADENSITVTIVNLTIAHAHCEQERNAFLDNIRTAFYTTATDCICDLRWTASVASKNVIETNDTLSKDDDDLSEDGQKRFCR